MHQASTTSEPALDSPSDRTLKPTIADTSELHKTADHRFLRLIGLEAWQRLPADVRARFSKDLSGSRSAVYQGRVIKTKLSGAGWLLARLTWLLGSPLPRDDNATGPAVVVVTQNPTTGAQNWIRTYSRPNGSMQTIASEKRFQGPTGLEEYVGAGIGMTLAVHEAAGTLVFQSQRYFFEVAGMRIVMPRLVAPGRMTIIHRDQGAGTFQFELKLEHAVFGCLLYQLAEFDDGP